MPSRYIVRSFEDGDEAGIVRVSNVAYSNYGGYTPKSPEYWRWCCLERPDVTKEGVIVALDKMNKTTVGYVVAGKSGNLWEMCYDPNENGKEIVAQLLEKAISYLENQGAASITFNALKDDKVVKDFCEKNGFSVSPTPQMFLSALNIQSLVTSLANYKAAELVRFDEELLIKISKAPFWIDDTVTMKINANGISISNLKGKPTIEVKVDYLTLSSMLFGKTSPTRRFARSQLKVAPLSKLSTALKILSELRINSKWSFQLSDYG